MTRGIPVRLDQDIVEAIDTLVSLGIYKSRSEALRELIKEGLRNLNWIIKVNKAVESLFEIERRTGKIPIELNGELKRFLEERRRS